MNLALVFDVSIMIKFELICIFFYSISLVYCSPEPEPNPEPEPQLLALGALSALGLFGYRAPSQYRPYQYPQSLRLDNCKYISMSTK